MDKERLMELQLSEWEKILLSMAYEARLMPKSESVTPTFNRDLLNWAYAHCEAMTARHSRSFFLASSLLPPDKRRAIRALYAFCRTTDDLVDQPDGATEARLNAWRKNSLGGTPPHTDNVAAAWIDTQTRYQIPGRYAEQLIEGVAQDLRQVRYETFTELTKYCYGVASTVGLMSMHIIGFHSDHAIPYAVKLGVALQLTNILRDIKEDWDMGRLYLPQEELQTFGLAEADIDRGLVHDRWRAFMKFQIARARRLHTEAWPGIALLAPEGRFATAAAAAFYQGILEDIEAHDYNVFNRRAYVAGWKKLILLPGLWWGVSLKPVLTWRPQMRPAIGSSSSPTIH
jgi:phytoene synthase